jgi:hypothetical protein
MNLEKLAVQVDKDYDAKFEELLEALKLTTDALHEVLDAMSELRVMRSTGPQATALECMRDAVAAADTALCPECLAYLRKHDHHCKLHPDHDPTPE